MWSAPIEEIPVGGSAKFQIVWRKRLANGFIINLGGYYYAYVNYCVHAGAPLDWWPNEFFTEDRRYLKCGVHGSLYDPVTGKCAGGPCTGGSLAPLPVQISNGRVIVRGDSNS
jgi:nitrite reductase/ring-hydroxylating ferredoxin subunit